MAKKKTIKQLWADAAEAAIIAAGEALKAKRGRETSAVARHFGLTIYAVCKWRSRIPIERVIALERLGNYRVSRHQMRPDIYPKEKKAA